MTKFPFTDLHSFKDYVGFVKLCAPTDFPPREGVGTDEQWTLDLAFDGLRQGLIMAIEEKGELPRLTDCQSMVENAFAHYRQGQVREGFRKLADVQRLLRQIPSQ